MSARKLLGEKKSLLKVLRCLVSALLTVGIAGIHVPVSALDLPKIWKDPLLANPPILEHGPMLPGANDAILCSSTEEVPQPLTLAHAIDIALCNNAQVRSAWAGIKVQAGLVGEARAAYLPTASVTLNRLRSRTEYSGADAVASVQDGHTVYGTLSWRLLDFGGRSANNQFAAKLLDAAMAGHAAAMQKSMAAVVGAYGDAMIAYSGKEARRKASEIAAKTLASTRKRESKGAVSMNDVLQATTAYAKARMNEHRAEGELRKSLALLAYTLSISPSASLVLPELEIDPPSFILDDLTHMIAEVRTTHPAIKAARAQLAASNAKESVVRSEGLPTLDFTTNYSQNGYPNQALSSNRSNTATVGLMVTIPVFDGFSRTYKIRGAQAQIEQSQAQLAEVEAQVTSDLVQAHAEAYSSLANLQSSDDLERAASAAVASSERRYSKGVADILELLSTQNSFIDAQQERTRCLMELRSAQLKLLSSAGILGRQASIYPVTTLSPALLDNKRQHRINH